QLCDATSTCVAGCAKDTDCTSGRACVSGQCRAGCRSSAECIVGGSARTQYCSSTTKMCTVFKGSGHCTMDFDCATNQVCNLSTLKCDTATGTRTCTGSNSCSDSGCSSGTTCVNNLCVARGLGAACSSYTQCGLDFTCSYATYTCGPARCTFPITTPICATGTSCDSGSSCQVTGSQSGNFCFPSSY